MVGSLQLTWSITASLVIYSNFVQVFYRGTLSTHLVDHLVHRLHDVKAVECVNRTRKLPEPARLDTAFTRRYIDS
jgi:hypothetical protein